MNILKQYIREVVKQTLHEQVKAGTPRLPEIPPATGGGAVPAADNSRLKKARVSFANTSVQYLTAYRNQLSQTRRFDPAIGENIYSVAEQMINQLKKDTTNWTTVPREIDREMSVLKPENSALASLRSNTEWAHTSSTPNNQELQQKYNEVVNDNIPRIIAALQAYSTFYSR